MAKITYVHFNGTETVIDVQPGNSVMRGAVLNGVDGIVGQCGGGAMCGTCHVYIPEGNTIPLPPMKNVEDELLYGTVSEGATTAGSVANSRSPISTSWTVWWYTCRKSRSDQLSII